MHTCIYASVHTCPHMLTCTFYAATFASPSVHQCSILCCSSSNYHMLLIMQNCQQFVFMESGSPAPPATILPSSVICSRNTVAWMLEFLLTLARARLLPAYQHLPTQVPSLELVGGPGRLAAKGSVLSLNLVTIMNCAQHVTASSSGTLALVSCTGCSLGCC